MEKLNIKNILDDVVKANYLDEKATTVDYEVYGGNENPPLNGAS